MIPLFCGYDTREAIGYAIFCDSVIRNSSEPVAFHPLFDLGKTDGSNQFTYARYSIPAMMGYQDFAIFADASDMLCIGDIAELWALRDDRYAVQLVKHPTYQTKHGTKYRGTSMESPNFTYPRKNWSSLMILNCAAPEWRELEKSDNRINKHRFQCFPGERIGDLPRSWNVLIDEGQDTTGMRIAHWTAGIPMFPYYRNAPGTLLWHEALSDLMRTP